MSLVFCAQSQLGQRDVKNWDYDLTRNPEWIKACRETWRVGVKAIDSRGNEGLRVFTMSTR
jgi:hypothetical protein